MTGSPHCRESMYYLDYIISTYFRYLLGGLLRRYRKHGILLPFTTGKQYTSYIDPRLHNKKWTGLCDGGTK